MIKMRPKKKCEWCGKEQYTTNLYRHLKTCIWKNEFKLHKSDAEEMRKEGVFDMNPEAKLKTDLENQNLRNFILENYEKFTNLYKSIMEYPEVSNPETIIKNILVSESTKENYLMEWKQFKKFLFSQRKPISLDSANCYIASLKCKTSTIRNKIAVLQTLMRSLINPSISLNKLRQKINYKPKHAMPDNEIKDYLREQSLLDTEFYCIQLLQIKYALRVSSCALLKRSQLEFLDSDEKNIINFYDVKNKKYIPKEIDEEVRVAVRNFLADQGDVDQNEYFFMRKSSDLKERRRSNELSKEINKRIRASKVFKINPNYAYSSHMFRKTVAQNIYSQSVSQAKEKARTALSQAPNSSAIDHYIDQS
jgi:hypothetical protein